MSRTSRKFKTDGNYREARGGRNYERRRGGTKTVDLIAAGMVEVIHGEVVPTLHRETRPTKAKDWGRRNTHGGMLQSRANTGRWGDELPNSNRRERSREKQAWRREI